MQTLEKNNMYTIYWEKKNPEREEYEFGELDNNYHSESKEKEKLV